ncbi:hypothetical protein HQ520_17865 [bacterium]|nr:hypothetical protein [bacterium]
MSELPRPFDVPEAPGNAPAANLGGHGLPEMRGKPSSDAPAIAMITESALPDETLVVTGENLDGAKLLIWTDGANDLRKVEPLRTFQNRMQTVVPAGLPPATMLV